MLRKEAQIRDLQTRLDQGEGSEYYSKHTKLEGQSVGLRGRWFLLMFRCCKAYQPWLGLGRHWTETGSTANAMILRICKRGWVSERLFKLCARGRYIFLSWSYFLFWRWACLCLLKFCSLNFLVVLISLSFFPHFSPATLFRSSFASQLARKNQTQTPKNIPPQKTLNSPKIFRLHTRRDERRAGVAALQRARKEAGGGGSAGAQFNIDNSAWFLLLNTQ